MPGYNIILGEVSFEDLTENLLIGWDHSLQKTQGYASGTFPISFFNNDAGYITSAPAPVWGGITGTLSSQTDLQTALDAKSINYAYEENTTAIANGDDFITVNYVGFKVSNPSSALQIDNSRPLFVEAVATSLTLDLTYAGTTIISPNGSLSDIKLPDPAFYGSSLYDGWSVEVKGYIGQPSIAVEIDGGGAFENSATTSFQVGADQHSIFTWSAFEGTYLARNIPSEIALNAALTAKVNKTGDILTGSFERTFNTLTDAANILINLTLNNYFRVVLGGNRTLTFPSGLPAAGQRQGYIIEVVQDGTGGRTLAFSSSYNLGEVDTDINYGANAVTLLSFIATDADVYLVGNRC